VVVLVVVLGLVEWSGRYNLGLDRLLEARLIFGLRGLRQALLLVVVVEDRRAVLVAAIAELAVLRERIVVVPEHVEELFVGDLGRVVDDLDRLGMAGAAAADVIIGRIGELPASIARGGADDAFDLVEIGLNAPEAT